MERILFVGHDANRAGAQYLLLHLLRYLKKTGLKTYLVLVKGGPLLAEYKEVTDELILVDFEPRLSSKSTKINKILKLIGWHKRSLQTQQSFFDNQIKDKIKRLHIDLIFSNTIANGAWLAQFEDLKIPFVVYSHELANSIKIYVEPHHLLYQLQNAKHILAGSHAVKDNFVHNHAVDNKDITVIRSLIDSTHIIQKLTATNTAAIKKRLNIPQDAVVIGGCGNAEWRKGVDIFVAVAHEVIKRASNVHFVWIGVKADSDEHWQLSHDLVRMGIADGVHLVPPSGDYLEYMACFDVFFLSSREDPYPLVMIEAGLNHSPVVAFAGSGGATTYLGGQTALLVPYLDISAAASVMLELINDPQRRETLGDIFFKKAQNHDVSVVVPQIMNTIKNGSR
jgi:glycosyltransferase involved in cell wall biosynthesis